MWTKRYNSLLGLNLKFLLGFTVAVAGPNVTRYPIIFTITIIFCQHVTNVTNVTSHYITLQDLPHTWM